MHAERSETIGSGSAGSENLTTSPGSKLRSPDTEHPVRNFVAPMWMALSIFFGWLAVLTAPWRYRKPTTPTPEEK